MARAIERGLSVQVVLDDQQARKSKSLGGTLADAGGHVRTWSRGELHAKFTLIDGRQALAGSYNWTRSGGESNVEVLISFEDEPTIDRFAELFELLWNEGRPLRP